MRSILFCVALFFVADFGHAETFTAEMQFAIADHDPEGVLTVDQVNRRLLQSQRFIQSDEIIRDAFLRPRIQATNWFHSFDDDPVAALRDAKARLTVEVDAMAGVMSLQFQAEESNDALIVLDEIGATFLDRLRLIAGQESAQQRAYLLGERNRTQDKVAEAIKRLQVFLKDHKWLPLTILEQRILNTESEISELTKTRQSLIAKSINTPEDEPSKELIRIQRELETAEAVNSDLKRRLVERQVQEIDLTHLREDLATARVHLLRIERELDELRRRSNLDSRVAIQILIAPTLINQPAEVVNP